MAEIPNGLFGNGEDTYLKQLRINLKNQQSLNNIYSTAFPLPDSLNEEGQPIQTYINPITEALDENSLRESVKAELYKFLPVDVVEGVINTLSGSEIYIVAKIIPALREKVSKFSKPSTEFVVNAIRQIIHGENLGAIGHAGLESLIAKTNQRRDVEELEKRMKEEAIVKARVEKESEERLETREHKRESGIIASDLRIAQQKQLDDLRARIASSGKIKPEYVEGYLEDVLRKSNPGLLPALEEERRRGYSYNRVEKKEGKKLPTNVLEYALNKGLPRHPFVYTDFQDEGNYEPSAPPYEPLNLGSNLSRSQAELEEAKDAVFQNWLARNGLQALKIREPEIRKQYVGYVQPPSREAVLGQLNEEARHQERRGLRPKPPIKDEFDAFIEEMEGRPLEIQGHDEELHLGSRSRSSSIAQKTEIRVPSPILHSVGAPTEAEQQEMLEESRWVKSVFRNPEKSYRYRQINGTHGVLFYYPSQGVLKDVAGDKIDKRDFDKDIIFVKAPKGYIKDFVDGKISIEALLQNNKKNNVLNQEKSRTVIGIIHHGLPLGNPAHAKAMAKSLKESRQLLKEAEYYANPKPRGVLEELEPGEDIVRGDIVGKGLPYRKHNKAEFIGFGAKKIHKVNLANGVLDVRFTQNNAKYNEMPNMHISPALRELIEHSSRDGKIHEDKFNGLGAKEKAIFTKLCRTCHVDYEGEKENLKAMKERFELLRGEICAGNDSKEVLHEFRGLLIEMNRHGLIGRNKMLNILSELEQI